MGLPGAVFLGLGSILGTGIFVSVGIAAGVAGSGVVLAVPLAALVATFNGLSSAQLAASHPVSGGTYEYGYRYLNPLLGFLSGWMFLAAKSASAATAALGFGGYLLSAFGVPGAWARIAAAVLLVFVVTALVSGGMRRSNRANAIIVAATLVGLGCFVVAGLPVAVRGLDGGVLSALQEVFGRTGDEPRALLHATALMFVAYTGYGRIATLGEEVMEPARTIPRAIVATLVVAMGVYVTVTLVAVGVSGADGLARATEAEVAPLEVVAGLMGVPGLAWIVGVSAVTALVGVLLNLILGLSRVVLAMARRGDVPPGLAHIDARTASPSRAVLVVGVAVAAIVLVGDVRTTWSFSAFTVLVYYALTNLAALRLPMAQRRFPRFVPALGLLSCLFLAVWVDTPIWIAGGTLLALGAVWHGIARSLSGSKPTA